MLTISASMARGEIPDHLHRALREGDCDSVRAWFEAEESRDSNMTSDGPTDYAHNLVQIALRSNGHGPERGDRTEMVRLLGARGADMNATRTPWLKPIFWSAHVGEMSAMIDYGADVNTLQSDLTSILMECSRYSDHVAFRDRAPLARLLVRRGADVFLKNKEGLDAEDHARFYIHQREDGSALADFLAAVKRAGSYAAYVRAPRVELVRLRTLCARGRARPPADPVLERLFGGAPETPSTTKSTRLSRRPLPNEVFWHVLAYWRTSRDDE